jgi:DNA-binding response OmpR family regulator
MKLNVLLVEDDKDVAETIISVFENFFEGSVVTHISDGHDFRKGDWKQRIWSIVVLDLMMPGITGFEVCEQLRAQKATKAVPILTLTGYDTLQNETRIKAAGASGYMAKPFEVDKFLQEVKRVLP